MGQDSPRKEATLQEEESPGNQGPLLVGRGGGWPRLLLVSMNFPEEIRHVQGGMAIDSRNFSN